MKPPLARYLITVSFCAFAAFSRAGDFKTVVFPPQTSPLSITVPDDRFLVVRNFTQTSMSGPPRGVVTVTNLNGVPLMPQSDILTAAIIDQMTSPGKLEVINNVVVAGPATVTVTCPTGATCSITYRKGED